IRAQLARRRAAADELAPSPPGVPEPPGPLWRQVRPCPPPEYATRPPPSLDEARQLMRDEIAAYLDLVEPEHILLIRAVPGVGKTTAGVETAELCAARGWRVAYAGPRHDFFKDVVAIAGQPRQ